MTKEIPPPPTQAKGPSVNCLYTPIEENNRQDDIAVKTKMHPDTKSATTPVPHLQESILNKATSGFKLSFEFFPPHTREGLEKLKLTTRKLETLHPEYFSVTFGAAGNTQSYTVETVNTLKQQASASIAPHISCIGSTPESIRQLLETYKKANINRLVVLRGDKPSGMMSPSIFRYAKDLIEFIRKETGNYFWIEVAAYPECHPEARNPDEDLENFKRKVAAGANSALTQYFYNIDSYNQFIKSCEKMGITVPIVPGIMPITNYLQLKRFSDNCGAEIPRWLNLRLQKYVDDPESLLKVGIEFVTDLCQRLLEQGAPGLHFYTLNKAEATMAICQQLSWK